MKGHPGEKLQGYKRTHISINKGDETVPCRYCKTPTRMLGTKECDGCHSAAVNIRVMSPVVLSKIIHDVMPEQARREVVVGLLAKSVAEKGGVK